MGRTQSIEGLSFFVEHIADRQHFPRRALLLQRLLALRDIGGELVQRLEAKLVSV